MLGKSRRVTGTVTNVTGTESQIGDDLSSVATAPGRAEKDQRRRQARRDKERRRRARRAEAARVAAIAEAERIEVEARDREARAEKLAPQVLRKEIVAPAVKATSWHDGRAEAVLVGPRVQIVDGRPVRAFGLSAEDDPVVKLARENKAITDRHTDAARRLQLDWEDVGGGLGLGAVDYLRTGGGGGGGAVNEAMLAQAAMRASLDGAMAHLGAFGPAVARIVLDCVPVYAWAAQVGKDMEAAIAWLVCALDRLAAFYAPEPRPVRVRIRTVGPSRAAYGIDGDAAEFVSPGGMDA